MHVTMKSECQSPYIQVNKLLFIILHVKNTQYSRGEEQSRCKLYFSSVRPTAFPRKNKTCLPVITINSIGIMKYNKIFKQ